MQAFHESISTSSIEQPHSSQVAGKMSFDNKIGKSGLVRFGSSQIKGRTRDYTH